MHKFHTIKVLVLIKPQACKYNIQLTRGKNQLSCLLMFVQTCRLNKRAGVSNRYVRRLGMPPLSRRRSRTSPTGRRSVRCPWAPCRDLHHPHKRPHKVSNRISSESQRPGRAVGDGTRSRSYSRRRRCARCAAAERRTVRSSHHAAASAPRGRAPW